MPLELATPDEFPAFPYNPPYEIQRDLMRHLYTSIEQKKVTIIESPTGTGKTLSLLCASLTWLEDDRQRAQKGIIDSMSGTVDDDNDWVTAQTRERYRRELEADEKDRDERLAHARKKEAALRNVAKAKVIKRPKLSASPRSAEPDDEDVFLPNDVDEDDNISVEVRALMAQITKSSRGHQQEEEPTCTKIFYASRTHSQLSQVLPELRKLKLSIVKTQPCQSPKYHSLPKKRTAEETDESFASVTSYSRTVSLGSRKQLCIHDELRSKSRDLDEACRDMLDGGKQNRCPYLPSVDNESQMIDLRDQILASPKDIEDLAEVGRLTNTCPYFGSRRAIPQAELVTLPYNLLLQKSAREALGIDLTNHIVIIDEAHNLIPTLLSLSTTKLPLSTLATSLQQVSLYVSKFRKRLSPANGLHLKRLVTFLDALKKYALEWKEQCKSQPMKTEVMSVLDLSTKLGRKVTGINLLEIESYLKKSKIARKIAGYSDKQAGKESGKLLCIHEEFLAHVFGPDTKRSFKRGLVPPLHAVEDFLLSLAGANDDGRVILSLCGSPGQEDVEFKYQLLNPAPHFREVVDAARSVILAGGTMSPISDVIEQLFSGLVPDRVTSFSCNHIIPSSNLLPLVVSKGPRGGELNYKAARQGDSDVVSELGQIISNFINIIPAGMIVFFPSYNFLNKVKELWSKEGMLTKFATKKKIFFEPTETTDVDRVLQEYSSAVSAMTTSPKSGALLFAVIGAKLSEGLNFADDLARAVIIVGLPFPNRGSPELQERLNYVKRLHSQTDGKRDPAEELYENLCMNAVNQSIGRAIRHRSDWASLILLDQRYLKSSIKTKLPRWIGSEMQTAENFGQTMKNMSVFFKSKRNVA